MAAWRESLCARITRFNLKFVHLDCLAPGYDELCQEVDDFLLIAQSIGGRGGAS